MTLCLGARIVVALEVSKFLSLEKTVTYSGHIEYLASYRLPLCIYFAAPSLVATVSDKIVLFISRWTCIIFKFQFLCDRMDYGEMAFTLTRQTLLHEYEDCKPDLACLTCYTSFRRSRDVWRVLVISDAVVWFLWQNVWFITQKSSWRYDFMSNVSKPLTWKLLVKFSKNVAIPRNEIPRITRVTCILRLCKPRPLFPNVFHVNISVNTITSYSVMKYTTDYLFWTFWWKCTLCFPKFGSIYYYLSFQVLSRYRSNFYTSLWTQ